jgi:nucleosome binding factor SPN SPT16 subunit
LSISTKNSPAKHLSTLKDGKIPVELLTVQMKVPETRTTAFQKCIDVIKGAGKKVGVIPNAQSVGPFVDEWVKMYGDISKEIEEVDVTSALSTSFALKDESELRAMRTAARAASGMVTDYWVEEMQTVLDREQDITHRALAEKINKKIDDNKFFSKMSKLPSDFDNQQLDWAYGPVVQSGGKYDPKITAQPNEDKLHSGCIFAGVGFRYKTYCSIVARTYLIDPSKSQTSNYKLLLAAHDAALKEIKDGALPKDVYNSRRTLARMLAQLLVLRSETSNSFSAPRTPKACETA